MAEGVGGAAEEWREAVAAVKGEVEGKGLEAHPFKVGWYNSQVEPAFRLGYHDDTLAILLLSTPAMFERLLLPYLMSPSLESGSLDPVDRCHKELFEDVARILNRTATILQDFELDAKRKPKVLVQTAGHVSGAVQYYQRSDVVPDPWSASERMYGVAVHPRYGGWFALRGVILFDDLRAGQNLKWEEPPDPVTSWEKRVELLEKFNRHWRDWSYRNVLDEGSEVVERYSEQQMKYFGTEPQERGGVIARLRGEPVVASSV